MPEKQSAPWPVPAFHFILKIDDHELRFQEVSGLDTENDVIEYRHGNTPEFSVIKMPGLKKASDITLKKGSFTENKDLSNYIHAIHLGTVDRRNMLINLLDETGGRVFQWALKNAFVKKVSGLYQNSGSNECAIETLVLGHEGLTMTNS